MHYEVRRWYRTAEEVVHGVGGLSKDEAVGDGQR